MTKREILEQGYPDESQTWRIEYHSPPDPRLAYSISETAKLLGVTHTTVRRWIALGRLKPIETSGWIRISQHEINRFLGL